jgi:hypothetical protein
MDIMGICDDIDEVTNLATMWGRGEMHHVECLLTRMLHRDKRR